jgi:hypothetical protein
MTRIEARLQLVTTYQQTGSISETARRWHTSSTLESVTPPIPQTGNW